MSPAKGRTDTPPRIWKGFNIKFWTNLWSPSTARAPKYLFNSFSGFKFLRRWKEERKAPSVKHSATLKSLHQHPALQSASGKPPNCHTFPIDQTQHGERRLKPARTGRESPASSDRLSSCSAPELGNTAAALSRTAGALAGMFLGEAWAREHK